jgi:hypothetical protein
MDLEGLEGPDSFTLARIAQIQAKRRAGWQEGWDLRSAVDMVSGT